MNKKIKDRKEKKRKETAKKRVLARREETRKQAKWSWNYGKAMDKFAIKPKPILNDDLQASGDITALEAENHNKSIKERLEHNSKILEALADQYDEEQKEKNDINKKLESEGAESFHDKMDLIADKAEQIINKKNKSAKIKGKFKPKFKPKDAVIDQEKQSDQP